MLRVDNDMDITYEASGGVETFGCALYKSVYLYITKFAPGSIVYLIKDATRGKLTKIFIKKIRFVDRNRFYTKMVYPPIYVDLYNAYYNENELCGYSQAYEIATEYWVRYRAILEEKTKHC